MDQYSEIKREWEELRKEQGKQEYVKNTSKNNFMRKLIIEYLYKNTLSLNRTWTLIGFFYIYV